MHSFRTHKTKFGINSGNTLIFIFQLQFSTVILFELIYLVKDIVLIFQLNCKIYYVTCMQPRCLNCFIGTLGFVRDFELKICE